MVSLRRILLATTCALMLNGCETLNLKLKGGSNSNVDWAVGIRF